MSDSKALALRQPLTPALWQMIREMAPIMHQSRLFGVASADTAAAIMLKGFELGLPLTAAFELIHTVQNKPSLSPRGALAILRQSAEFAGIEIKGDDKSCTITMRRKGGEEYTLTWTMEDAKRAGLVKTDSGWEKYPANMLKWRCLGFVADVLFPDVLAGLKRADEYGADIDPDGNVIEDQPSMAPVESKVVNVTMDAPIIAAPAIETKPIETVIENIQKAQGITLDDLLAEYGAEKVLVANEGRIPATNEEVAAVHLKLLMERFND